VVVFCELLESVDKGRYVSVQKRRGFDNLFQNRIRGVIRDFSKEDMNDRAVFVEEGVVITWGVVKLKEELTTK
jgi:hypothetical protein